MADAASRPAALPLPSGIEEGSVFRSLFIAYPDGLLLVDRAGAIVLANPSAASLLGYAVEELSGTSTSTFRPGSSSTA